MSNKKIIIHGLLNDVIDYKALIEHQANQGVTKMPIQKSEVSQKGKQKVRTYKRTNRK